MSKKKGNLLEQHVDKIVLGVIALLCLYLIWATVIRNPYGAQKPGQIDKLNERRAEDLEQKLKGPSEWPPPPPLNQLAKFEEQIKSPVALKYPNLSIPIPYGPRDVIDDERRYPLPEVVAISGIKVQPIRGAAWLPVDEITVETPYESVGTELGDMDMVSVSGRVDLQTLHRNFQQSFMGPRLKSAWRDAGLATPVIAQVELQRQQLLENGRWSEWQTVPRPRIDPYGKQVDQMPMRVDQMDYSGGVSLLMTQYKPMPRQLMLLQPRAYDFATWKVPYWLPPEFYKEYTDRLQRLEDEQKRQMRDQAQPGGGMPGMMEPGGARDARRPQPARRGNQRDMGPMGNMGMSTPETDPRKTVKVQTPDEVLRNVSKEFLNERSNLSTLSSALVWAHDDTTSPGQTYRYRLRLGVFNPIAGRNWFLPEQEEYKNQIVLWGPYSEPTSEVVIPRMLHIFPTGETAEEPGALKVEVAKFNLGKWQTHEFTVYPGQVIGSPVEIEENPGSAQSGAVPAMNMGMGMMGMGAMNPMGTMPGDASAPTTIDFSTPYLYVDMAPRVEWSEPPTIRRKAYNVMLYTQDGSTVESLPVGNRNWPRDLQKEYTAVKAAEREAKDLQYLPRSTQGQSPGMMPTTPTAPMPGMPGMPGMTGMEPGMFP